MANYDSFDYEINKRMPEWYKHSNFLQPINQYTQELISQLINGLLTSTGAVQPLNCWLTIPEEYDWFHHYRDTDEYLLAYNPTQQKYVPKGDCILTNGNPVVALLPNTKRKCHAKIRLKLLGNADDIPWSNENDNEIEYYSSHFEDPNSIRLKDNLINLTLINGTQKIYLKKISKASVIEINTKTNEILIDGVEDSTLIEGSFNKIEPQIKNDTYKEEYIDNDGQIQYKNIDLEDENKETKLILESNGNVEFDLQIKLYKPTYATEQNIRVATVSAFPIEWIRLYGYFCHPFNNKSGYKFLWEKQYSLKSRTVYDNITKQFDCERFYVQVKFHGIGVPLVKGFPQEELSSEFAFQPNPNLDKWGKIYGLNRRYYREDITEDEEPYTFPKYYPYPIEQDYWYEERIINEYRLDDESINSLFVKDTDLDNIILLNCIYPFMNDIWVYTETINPDAAIKKASDEIKLYSIEQDLESPGVEWEDVQLIKSNQQSKPITINPHSNDILKLNDYSYQSKKLHLTFYLEEFKNTTPDDIIIKGIELNINADTNVKTNLLRLTPDSYMKLPYILTKSLSNGEEEIINIVYENIDISGDMPVWNKEKIYTIGDSNYLFGEEKISKEQLCDGNEGKLEFNIGFVNESDFLAAYLLINSISVKIHYEEIKDKFEINMYERSDNQEPRTLIRDNGEDTIKIRFFVKNESDKKIANKQVTIITSPEFSFVQENFNGFIFDLEKDESFETEDIELRFIGNKTGKYNILAFCDDKVMKKEIVVRNKANYEVIQ